MDETKFWVVALAAIILYGFMAWGAYAIPMAMGFDSSYPTLRGLFGATLGTYAWLPSFLAGLLARRRAVLLGVLTFVGGTVCAVIFRVADTTTPPLLTEITWQGPILRPYAALLEIALAVISSFAGQSVVFRSRSKSLGAKTTRIV
jgi:hypothetical protein